MSYISRKALAIFVLALAVRAAIVIRQHSWQHTMRAEMEKEAISLATTGVLGNPFSVPSGPSAIVPPAYPIVMAGIFYLFGVTVVGEATKVALTCVISSAQYALLPWLGKTLELPGTIGLTAGLFGALLPLNPYIEVQGDFENHISAVLVIVLLAVTVLLTRRRWNFRLATGLGAFYALCALDNPALIPLCFLSLVYITIRQVRIWRVSSAPAILSFAIAALLLLPWLIRNYVELGAPVATRSGFGLEFSLANNDAASPLMMENGRLYECCHPLQNVSEGEKFQRLGELEYNSQALQRSMQWVREHPHKFLWLTAQRIWYMWMPKAPERLRQIMLRLLTVLALIGLIVIRRIRPMAALILATTLFVYALPYYLVQIHFRYRYPTGFIVLLASAAAIWHGVEYLRSKHALANHRYSVERAG